jgi:hypothetical protein
VSHGMFFSEQLTTHWGSPADLRPRVWSSLFCALPGILATSVSLNSRFNSPQLRTTSVLRLGFTSCMTVGIVHKACSWGTLEGFFICFTFAKDHCLQFLLPKV